MIQFSDETRAKIAELCKKNKVRELSLFGSRARGDNRPDSDYDLLVVFDPNARISLFDFARTQVELEDLIGLKVDLVEKEGLKPIIRDSVLAEAEVIYENR